MKKKLVFVYIINWLRGCTLVMMLFFPAYGHSQYPALGAVPGERLTFDIHWMGISAGTAYMAVQPVLSGQYAMIAGVESIGVVKFLHPIKDQLRTEGFLLATGFSSRYYAKHQQRGEQSRLIEYRFDREWGQALRTQEGEETLEIGGVSPQVNDMITGFFSLRACSALKPGASLYVPMLDGKKIYEVSVTIGTNERLTTPLGEFDVIPMTVVVENSEMFRLQGSIVVWLTNDQRRLPVRVESRINFKSVVADLVFYDDGRGEHREVKRTK